MSMQGIVYATLSCFTEDIIIVLQTCCKLCTSMHICTTLRELTWYEWYMERQVIAICLDSKGINHKIYHPSWHASRRHPSWCGWMSMQSIAYVVLYTRYHDSTKTCHKICTSLHMCTMLESSLGINETCSNKSQQLPSLKPPGGDGIIRFTFRHDTCHHPILCELMSMQCIIYAMPSCSTQGMIILQTCHNHICTLYCIRELTCYEWHM